MKVSVVNLLILLLCSIGGRSTQTYFTTEYLPTKEKVVVVVEERKAEKIAKAIKFIESNGRYEVLGASGEKGAYQILKPTWEYWCKKHLSKRLEMTPKNQDTVVVVVIQHYLDRGYNELQIASIWNCGRPNWDGKIGTNKYGVPYNVPAYVEKFRKVYYDRSNS